jgi:GT2 family glycosyltransferase
VDAKIGIVVVTFQTWDDTVGCLTSLQEASLGNAVTYVVDNGINDGTFERLRPQYAWVRYVHTGSNLGYCGGNNVGISLALAEGCDAVLILNPDVRVAPDFLHRLREAMFVNPGCDAAGPIWRTLDAEQRLARNVAVWDDVRADYVWASAGATDERTVVRTDAISGCCMLLSREIVERVGLFDERFFMYVDEIDLCRRMNVAGARLLIVPGAVIWHRIERGAGGRRKAWRTYYHYRNRLLFLQNHGLLGAGAWRRVLADLITSACRLSAKDPAAGLSMMRNGLLGIRDFRNGRFGLRVLPN